MEQHAIDLSLVPHFLKPRLRQLQELEALVESPPPGVDVAQNVEAFLEEANTDLALSVAVYLDAGIEPSISTLGEHIRRLSSRKKSLVGRRKLWRGVLGDLLDRLSLRRLDGPTVAVSRRPGAWRVEVDPGVDVELLDPRFVRRPPPEPDLEAIEKALQAGEDVPGFRRVQGPEGVQLR